MKLRNKKTGKIHEITEIVPLHDMDKKFVIYSKTEGHNYAYINLAELNEEWEDYEEPKEYYWYINDLGFVCVDRVQSSTIMMHKKFGNYYVTKEEAEKAVEKLKAWKRPKDKGCRVTEYKTYGGTSSKGDFIGEAKIILDIPNEVDKELLSLLFGGKE